MKYRFLLFLLVVSPSVRARDFGACARGFALLSPANPEEKAALEKRAQRILREHSLEEAQGALSDEQRQKLFALNEEVQKLENQIAAKVKDREVGRVPAHFVYRVEKPAPEPRPWNRQLDTLLRQNRGARVEFDPLTQELNGDGGLTDGSAISIGHFENYAGNGELDDILQHEGIHLRLNRAKAAGAPSAFDANVTAEGSHTLGKPPYDRYLDKQEEATFRNQTKTALRYAKDAAIVKAALGEDKVPLNITRRTYDLGVHDHIGPDGRITADFPVLHYYRDATAISLANLRAAHREIASAGAKAYTTGTEEGIPSVAIAIRDAKGDVVATQNVYLPALRSEVKRGKWTPAHPRLLTGIVEKRVAELEDSSRMLHAEAMAITKEVDPALYERLTGETVPVVAPASAPPPKTPLSKDELRELVELTRQHAEAVRKVMEMLGNKTGKVLRLRSQDPRE